MTENYTQVGDHRLPELPPGWMVSVDTEGSGLFGDGDPFAAGSRAAQPEARVSVVSVSFREPVYRYDASGTVKSVEPGDIVDFAWPFDQGPLIGKPGTPDKDPDTNFCTFKPIDLAHQTKLLDAYSKLLGFSVTMENAAPNLPATEYAKLIAWLDRRDTLCMHNSVHDMHVFRYGLRAGAGGDESINDGDLAWDPDTEPGCWQPGQPQRLHMMEPSEEPLVNPASNRRTIWCTMVTQKQLVEPLQPAALKPTSNRLWGDDESNEAEELAAELRRNGTGLTKRYDLLPWCGAMGRYAAKDTNLCLRLHEHQEFQAESNAALPGFWDLFEAEMSLRTTLYRMERRGVAYAADESEAEGNRVRALNQKLAATLPFDPSKLAQVKRFYFGPVCSRARDMNAGPRAYPSSCAKACPECGGKNGMGLEPLERTEKTQAPKLDLVEVAKLVEEERPYAAEYLLWSKRRNSNSKWYTGWAKRTGRDGRIRTSFKQCKNDRERAGAAEGGTKSGRLAVGRWQCQAIPHKKLIPEGCAEVRPFIGAEDEYELYEHDLAAGEMRVVTVIANSTKLWDALDAGADTHGMNAKAFFDVDPDHPDFYDLRQGAKRGTFGVLYGGSARAVHKQIEAATGMKFPLHKIVDAIENFFTTYPEFRTLTQQAEQRVTRWMGGPGYLRMLDGWRRWYALDEKTNSAVNQIIQGNLARAMIYWMLEVERQLPGVLLLQIHDSLVTRHRRGPEGAKEAQRVSDIGNKAFGDYFNVRNRWMDFGITPERWEAKG